METKKGGIKELTRKIYFDYGISAVAFVFGVIGLLHGSATGNSTEIGAGCAGILVGNAGYRLGERGMKELENTNIQTQDIQPLTGGK